MADPEEILDDLPTADAVVDTDSSLPETVDTNSGLPETVDMGSSAESHEAPQRRPVTRTKKVAKKKPPASMRRRKPPQAIQTTETTTKPTESPETPLEPLPADTSKSADEAPKVPPAEPPAAVPPVTQAGVETATSRPVQAPPKSSKPLASVQVPEQGDLVASSEPVLLGSGRLEQVMVHRWDEMMTTLSAPTRNAIWEQGLADMESLLRTPRDEIVKPKGQLSEVQCAELEAWVGRNGYVLPKTAQTIRKAIGRPPSIAVDVKTGVQVNNQKLREARVQRMQAMRSGG